MANMTSAMGHGRLVFGDQELRLNQLKTVASVYQKLTPRGSITKGHELTLKSDLEKHAATVASKQ